jgi:hypothetical protein
MVVIPAFALAVIPALDISKRRDASSTRETFAPGFHRRLPPRERAHAPQTSPLKEENRVAMLREGTARAGAGMIPRLRLGTGALGMTKKGLPRPMGGAHGVKSG